MKLSKFRRVLKAYNLEEREIKVLDIRADFYKILDVETNTIQYLRY